MYITAIAQFKRVLLSAYKLMYQNNTVMFELIEIASFFHSLTLVYLAKEIMCIVYHCLHLM